MCQLKLTFAKYVLWLPNKVTLKQPTNFKALKSPETAYYYLNKNLYPV